VRRTPLPVRAVLAFATVTTLSFGLAAPASADPTDGTFTGHYTTAANAPIADAIVTALTATDQRSVASTQTAADGSYSLTVPAGSYVLSFNDAQRGAQYAHQKRRPLDADTLTVTAGATTTVDEVALPSGTIAGHLTDTAGKAVEGSTVRAIDEAGQETGFATTFFGGEYTLRGLAPGRYRVSYSIPSNFFAVQYAPGKLVLDQGTQFDVAADQTVTVDDQLLPTGTLAGQVSDAAGAPLAHSGISIFGADQFARGAMQSDADGRFHAELFPGQYKIMFTDAENMRFQFFVGSRTLEDATAFTVTAGQTTTVADHFLPMSSVRVTATDAHSGRHIADFCASVDTASAVCSNGAGFVVVTGVIVGAETVFVSTPDGRFNDGEKKVTVVADRTVNVNVPLRPAASISTVVRDAATGKPVEGACVSPVQPPNLMLPDFVSYCSDAQGRMRIGPLEAGDYALFIVPPQGSAYGKQWVGKYGGTGDPTDARVIHATVGRVATIPDVRLDRAGSITGRVTNRADGKPVTSGTVGLSAFHPGIGPVQAVVIDGDGRYTIDGLGPYAWPLLFAVDGKPAQWSGAAPNRSTAKLVKVRAGKTTTFDQALVDGTTVTGTSTTTDFIIAGDVRTGDIVGAADTENGHYTMEVLGPQVVRISFGEGKLTGRVTIPPSGTITVNQP
jgi:hypothetical protein